MRTSKPDETRLIEAARVTLAGRVLVASLYASANRRTGRRIVVREGTEILFDTRDCYNYSNAEASYNQWLQEQQPMECVHCGTKDRGAFAFRCRDAESGGRICDRCAAKAIAPPEPANAHPLTDAEKAVDECPF